MENGSFVNLTLPQGPGRSAAIVPSITVSNGQPGKQLAHRLYRTHLTVKDLRKWKMTHSLDCP